MALHLTQELQNGLLYEFTMLGCKIISISEGAKVGLDSSQAVELEHQTHGVNSVWVSLSLACSQLLDELVELLYAEELSVGLCKVMQVEDLSVIPGIQGVHSLIGNFSRNFHCAALQQEIGPVVEDCKEIVILEEVLISLGLVLIALNWLRSDPMLPAGLNNLALEFSLDHIDKVLSSLLKKDIVVTLPSLLDIPVGS